MLKNREVFLKDPITNPIPNEGVAEVGAPRTPQQWEVLRWELSSFVCEGEYLHGLERILSTFLQHLDQPKQPAVWVSGFYGSGKTHLVRVLDSLWRNLQFPDGTRARSLVQLPAEINALLKELDTAGRRSGRLWSASGKMGGAAGSSVRMAILGILLGSAGLPTFYPAARLVLWLKHEGHYDAVRSAVERQDRPLERELRNMYVSDVLARALVETIPDFAHSRGAVRDLLRAQYPTVDDVSDDDLVHTMEEVLELQSVAAGKLPCTLLVLDELQQFIGENAERALHVQEVVEACSAQFGSRLLFVGTGQSAIQGTPQLSKLQGRFTVRVTLSDRDIEAVVREVVLRKAPDRVPELKALLSRAGGEIDRQLAGTRIGPRLEDAAELVPDYPLLPVRRRFWERILRVVDASGTAGQLRTQLRVVHDAAARVGDLSLGCVIPGDAIFDELKGDMLQTGVLLRETAQTIEEQDDGTEEGRLRSRLCATVFLLGKLPAEGAAATGVRATADVLADLLVENLVEGSAGLRARIPALLEQLVESGKLMLVGDEYRLQTRESAEWEAEFRRRSAQIRTDDGRIAGDRAEELKKAVEAALKGLSFVQGASKTARKFQLHFGPDAPSIESGAVPVWVRDEWSVSEKAVQQDAQAAGIESPTVFVYLPRRDSDVLRTSLAAYAAAVETLSTRPASTTPEAIDARKSMESRRDIERQRLNGLVGAVLENARVFQGGGNEVLGDNLREAVQNAVSNSLARMFPRFKDADHTGWDRVFQRATQGAADALSAVGYTGDPEKNAVCAEVRSFVGPAGKKGSEVRKHFAASPWGWPQDAVDAALMVLVAGGYIRASRSGVPITVKEIERQQIGTTDFHGEGVTLTTLQKIELRKLATDVGIPAKPGEEAEAVALLLDKLLSLARESGGDPPLPERPSTAPLEKLRAMAGNEKLVAVHTAREELLKSFQTWSRAREKARQRLPRWLELERLLEHARDLPVHAEVRLQVEAIQAQRSVLEDPDPTTPLHNRVAAALRSALLSRRDGLQKAQRQALEELQNSSEWQRLPEADRSRLIVQHNLDAIPSLTFSTNEELLATLDTTSLADWKDKTEAVPARAATVREAAARLLEPKAARVQLPAATLKTAEEMESYLDRLRTVILLHLEAGHPVILSPWTGGEDGPAAQ